jgi:hypothetical protein
MADEANQKVEEAKGKQPDSDPKHSDQQPRWWGLTRFEWVISCLTLLAAIIAGLTGIILWKQVKESQIDQRAWIVARQNGTIQALPDEALALPIRASNVGKTPARNIVGRYYVDVIKNGEAPNFDYNERRPLHKMYSGDLFPNDNVDTFAQRYVAKPESQTDTLVWALSDTEYRQLMRGTSYVAVHGILTYEDVFRVRHWKTFCMWFPFASVDYSTGACVAHNANDDHGEPYIRGPKPIPHQTQNPN